MKIGIFTDVYYPALNGVVTSLSFTADQLEKLGHEVFVAVPDVRNGNGASDKPNVFRIPSIEVYSKYDINASFPLPTKKIRNLLTSDFDVIHSHGCGTVGFFGYQLSRIKKIPYVFTYHTFFSDYVPHILGGKVVTPGMVKWYSRFFCNLCDTVVAPSEKIEKALIKWGVEKPIVVIHNSVDIKCFVPGKSSFLVDRGFVSESDFVFLYAGRLNKEKSVEFLIKAFARVSKTMPSARLVLVGDGTVKKNLEELVMSLGATHSIIFTGQVPAPVMPEVYKSSDCFVMASTTEVHPMVVLEASACGLPVVVVKDAAYTSTVENGTNGFVVKHNIERFGEALSKIYSDSDLRERMGSASRRIVEQRFSPSPLTKRLVRLYQDLIDSYS